METFTQKTFAIPELAGISAKNIEEHLKLYAGYVKFSNQIQSDMQELLKDSEKNAYIIGEMNRRFAFEFNGMRNHEYYFASFVGGAKNLADDSKLKAELTNQYGSFENWLARFKATAMTRGIGWAMLYHDKKTNKLLTSWVDEQHLGQLNGCQVILALDMWEHAYVYDYPTSEKKKYVEAFFTNLNWEVIENNFTSSF
ncbi:MAG: superoxide dismutase, Fe-Mn family [Patescibacteria group bacterium]|nr:superoxide dismutase, Fe-Mn family [Patescibacteria group bacterium]